MIVRNLKSVHVKRTQIVQMDSFVVMELVLKLKSVHARRKLTALKACNVAGTMDKCLDNV